MEKSIEPLGSKLWVKVGISVVNLIKHPMIINYDSRVAIYAILKSVRL